MSRIRGIETRIPKGTALVRNEVQKRIDDHTKCKDDAERRQIVELLQKLPKLDKIFEVHKKIGEGTFSSVYLGSLRQHSKLSISEKKWFAIKHLVPTAHPARIEHELRCLQDMGGRNHVIGVELCLRHLDTIVFVMPYIPHRKFSEYIVDMDAAELQRYMRALMTALKHVHSFGVIHRDVKPSNFLYDRENKRYLLVDFGLAQRICPAPDAPAPPPAHEATPETPVSAAAARKRPNTEEEGGPSAKRVALDLSTSSRVAVPVSQPRLPVHLTVKLGPCDAGAAVGTACACAGRGAVCAGCARRPGARASRAGTQGFRPPEVLLKVCAQGTGVDTWAAGVILASVLTRRYPLLRAAGDLPALAELAALLGTRPLQHAASAMGRRLVVSCSLRGVCLRKLCARLRAPPPGPPPATPPPGPPPATPPRARPAPCGPCRLPPDQCLCPDPNVKATDIRGDLWWGGFPDAAFSLACGLLQPLPAQRLTADQALRHPFLAQPSPGPGPGEDS
ncbi:unnamed protein product [Chilo suppressalis]|uniref:non-specific serine/threonine protein kinase n=1 Tax=Chilo suppressalis TaxID=168631 RepID=A0ABN8BAI0_CHISP|nr:unnamed protein product [Chilo suppressalis]